MKLSPYQRIIRAAESGRGVVLSHEECCKLSNDSAIETVASYDNQAMEADKEEARKKANRKRAETMRRKRSVMNTYDAALTGGDMTPY